MIFFYFTRLLEFYDIKPEFIRGNLNRLNHRLVIFPCTEGHVSATHRGLNSWMLHYLSLWIFLLMVQLGVFKKTEKPSKPIKPTKN